MPDASLERKVLILPGSADGGPRELRRLLLGNVCCDLMFVVSFVYKLSVFLSELATSPIMLIARHWSAVPSINFC